MTKKTRKKKKIKSLSTSDYKKILKYYKLSIPKKRITLKKKAETIIAKKFCSCIKKVAKKVVKKVVKKPAVKKPVAKKAIAKKVTRKPAPNPLKFP